MGPSDQLDADLRRPRRGLALALAALIAPTLQGCILLSPSYDEYPPTSVTESGSGAASSTTFEISTSAAATTATTATMTTATTTTGETSTTTGSTSAATTITTTTTGSTSTGSTTGDNEAEFAVTSCLALQELLKAEDLPLASGVYELQNPNGLEPVEVYCDLGTAGGGWLLAGRSTPAGAAGSFGWQAQTGDVNDDQAPYSLGFHLYPFEFTEILIGSYDGGKAWGEYVYRLGVPADLVQTFGVAGIETTYVGAVKGQCQPADGPSMFTFIGNTEKTDTFWLRNKNANNADFGLRHDGFDTYAYDCPGGGLLKDKQGMIMVR